MFDIKDIFKPIADIGGKIIDHFPDPNKVMELKAQLDQAIITAQSGLEQELTKRHQADMMSDSKLSKNIRPIGLVFLSLQLTFVIVLDYFGFSLSEIVLSVLANLLYTVFGFYFGGRTIEKIGATISSAIKGKGK